MGEDIPQADPNHEYNIEEYISIIEDLESKLAERDNEVQIAYEEAAITIQQDRDAFEDAMAQREKEFADEVKVLQGKLAEMQGLERSAFEDGLAAGNRTQSEAHIEIEVLTVQLEEAKEEIRGLKAASQEALLNGNANSDAAAQEMLQEQIEKQNKLNIRVEELMCELDKSQTNIQAYERMLEIERNKYEEELLDQKVHYEK